MPPNSYGLARRWAVILLAMICTLTSMPAIAHAQSAAPSTLNGTLKTSDGFAVPDAVITVSVEPQGAGGPSSEVGWAYTYEDGSFYTWIGFPEQLAAARDANGLAPVAITTPGADGSLTYLYRGPVKLGDDGVVRPHGPGLSGDYFNLVVISGDTASDDPFEEMVTPTLTGTLKTPAGRPVPDAVITVAVESADARGSPTDVGWGYTWADGSFETWIAHPGVLNAARDDDGLISLIFTAPTSAGQLTHDSLAAMGADGVLRPYTQGPGGDTRFPLVVTGSDPAEPQDPATVNGEQVASAVTRASDVAAAELNPTDPFQPAGNGSQAVGQGASVVADGTSATASLTGGQVPIDISLPAGGATTDLQVTNNGTAVLADGDDLDIAVQSFDTGTVRLNSVLGSANAPTVQSYELDLPAGARLQPIPGGDGFLVVVKERILPPAPADDTAATFDYAPGSGSDVVPEPAPAPDPSTEPLWEEGEQDALAAMVGLAADEVPAYRIDTPWAVDANGVRLPTSYSVNGTTLSQTVDTRGAAFPVVADPAFIPVIIWLTVAAGRAAAPAVARALAAQTIKQTVRATTKGGFTKFKDFKKKHVTGKEKTHDWHHIVEQSNIGRHGWNPKTIHHKQNLVQVPRKIHQQCISARMSSKNMNIPGRGNIRGHSSGPYNTLRDSIKNMTFERQYQIGVLLMQYCGLKI